MGKKPIKVGVRRGSGPPPGYRWTVRVLEVAYREARKLLTPGQYDHVAGLVRQLAREVDPTHPAGLSVDAVEDFHELRDKGGILGGLNVRVFFLLDKAASDLVVLGAIGKQNDGPTPQGDKIRMRRRGRKYRSGDFEEGP